ncbi:DEAD-box helicase 52 L homeolog [Xenopus laevis]|uniref:ATP-dependent RNA helicase n=1 Tax=Xenopus laevis TaxID=8355 RepID=Q7ZY19_XENLA|nr:DEAD-box helicase 52 L homeolog [Xenopus laevis]AAH44017.1 MGC53409 protein [Xenopus laevis]
MDAFDLFRKLGSGARFDLKRFSGDAEKFKLKKGNESSLNSSAPLKSLDFFGAEEKTLSRTNYMNKDLDQRQNGDSDLTNKSSKRKKDVGKGGKKLKIQEPDTGGSSTGDDSILWMSSLEAKLKDSKGKSKKKISMEKMEQQRLEKINHFRNEQKIYIQGTDIPEPAATFQQLEQEYKIHSKIMQNVKDAGFHTPTPIQMQAIPIMLHGREILASAPTGSGKTMAFSIPILAHLQCPKNKGCRALVISPTRELASQTQRELVKLSDGIGFRIHVIDKAAVAAKKFGPKSSKKIDILVTTPNRLIYLLKQDPPGIDLSSVEWLIVDESDKLFEDGKTGFRDQLASIFVACTSHLLKRAMFSATFAFDVEQWCKLHLDNVVSVSVGARNSAVETVEQSLLFVGSETGKLLAMRNLIKKGFTPPVLAFVQSVERAKELFHVEQWCKLHLDNVVSVSVGARNSAVETVEQSLLFVGSETGKLLAMRNLIKKGFTPPVLAFVQSVERAKELFHELIYEGINVDVIHAERTQQQRDNVIQSFREGKIWVLICTALLARGIDFKGVNMVINYDFPTSAVEYIHRIGRTGRAGHRGKAVSFFTEDDKPMLRSVASVIQKAGCPIPDYIKSFRKLQSKQKKRMIKRPLKRAQIRTTPKYILEKAKRKRNIIKKNLKEKESKASSQGDHKQPEAHDT